jgi:yecA family protein
VASTSPKPPDVAGAEREPLSASERAGLADLLAELAPHTGGMTLDAAQGLIVATLSGPHRLPAASWLRHAVGVHAPGDGATTGVETLLRRFGADTAAALELGTFAPLVPFQPVAGGEPLPLPYAWCAGYATGLSLFGEEVFEAIDQEAAAADALAAVLSFLMVAPEDMLDPKDPEAHRAVAAELGPAAVTLYGWWRSRRSAAGD